LQTTDRGMNIQEKHEKVSGHDPYIRNPKSAVIKL